MGRHDPGRGCSEPDCHRPHRARGFCSAHYAAWRRALAGPVPPLELTRLPTENGYIRVWDPTHATAKADGYCLEHRKVAWDAGLLTDLALDVHHRNEDKTDNRPANLEVMAKAEHHRHHVRAAGMVTNQFGTWPLRA